MPVFSEDNTTKLVLFLRICFWVGAIADLLATIPLLFPEAAKFMFGLQKAASGSEYFYASRIAATLVLGWACLLAWGSIKPVERKELLIFTVVPVLAGLLSASGLAVHSGYIEATRMLPLWIFYALIIPLYLAAYSVAKKIEASH